MKNRKVVILYGNVNLLEMDGFFEAHARLFEVQEAPKGHLEWRDTGIRTESRQTPSEVVRDGAELALREGAEFLGWGPYLDGHPLRVGVS